MKIALVSTIVPFVLGGARNIVEWLEETLRAHGHQVERIYLPFVESYPPAMFPQIDNFRTIDLSGVADLLIAFRPPAYVLPHPRKVLWFIHHVRVFYDAWPDLPPGHPHAPMLNECRRRLFEVDNATIREARRVFTNSRVVSQRLRDFNGIESETLYPPIYRPERFRCDGYNDEVVFVSRMEPHKRQHLMIEAMRHVKTAVRLRLCGAGLNPSYVGSLQKAVHTYALRDRVTIESLWIGEEEKVRLIGRALACAYVPHDEDSYGYPSLEAAHAQKAILTTTDSGGVLELIEHGVNGLIAEPDPVAIADALDALYRDRDATIRMGRANQARVAELKIGWDHVVAQLLT
jgi:glycosyltransferase involved in cell wall biosynthesis